MMKLVVFAAFLAVAFAESKKCPWIIGKQPFNESKFEGQWKIIAGTRKDDGPHNCSTINYKITKGMHSVQYNAMKEDGTKISGDFVGQSFGKAGMDSTVLGVYMIGDKRSDIFKQAIVTTDYDNFALMMACTHTFNDKTKEFGRIMKATMMSRSESLNSDTIKILKNVMSSYDIDPNEIVMFNHTGC